MLVKKKLIKDQIKRLVTMKILILKLLTQKINKKERNTLNIYLKNSKEKQGLLEWDCDRLVRNDRVIWASCMVACGDADAMITGNTRRYSSSLEKIIKVVDPRPGEIMFGLNLVVNRGKTIFICDTSVIEYPDAKQLAEMAKSVQEL